MRSDTQRPPRFTSGITTALQRDQRGTRACASKCRWCTGCRVEGSCRKGGGVLYCIFHCVFSYSVLRTFCYGRQHCISLAIHHKLRSAKTNWLSCETPLLVWYGWCYDRSTFRPHCRASKIGHLWQCYILPSCLSLLNRHVNHPVSRHHPLSSAAFSQIRSHLTRQMRSELHVALQPPAIICVRNLVLWGCSACVITRVQTLIPS